MNHRSEQAAKDATAARAMAVRLLEESAAEQSHGAVTSWEVVTIRVAQAQVWATLAVSLELASGIETFES